jgi:transposase
MSTAVRAAAETEGARQQPRRRRSVAEKRRIVEETMAADASVARVARAHGVNANQLFSWRRLYQRGLLGGSGTSTALVPVTVSDSPTVAAEPPSPSILPGSIQLRLAKGQLRVEGAVDAAALRVVLDCLLG